ncbi:hypothetical protein [Halomicrococcus gelatinilyticus]|uniref:hypothetical protein n=1 Tax=Halomicrococcus gelatinilyticus TaxID=1702103 RepID=UPI002E13F1B6
MTDTSVPKVDVDDRIEIGLSLIAILLGALAAYFTGKTGEPQPLLWLGCAGLTLFVLFFTEA